MFLGHPASGRPTGGGLLSPMTQSDQATRTSRTSSPITGTSCVYVQSLSLFAVDVNSSQFSKTCHLLRLSADDLLITCLLIISMLFPAGHSSASCSGSVSPSLTLLLPSQSRVSACLVRTFTFQASHASCIREGVHSVVLMPWAILRPLVTPPGPQEHGLLRFPSSRLLCFDAAS